ncbi:hypothetical protein EV191_102169 [Tamaricihabitans halophyticus]|uniref:PH (Pleckstrin Homology) domain-containing protein n=1 Tax=Tamaricihabitans halophyticus TaxID=1262583 RepID=A0A4R2R0I9_9PSEU|nr:hypothetical protein [Tamaricihabitans halophyticus]TCP54958.1 hypothetical protein EV191_102169 [Tamaricihabitans halophyticus]
MATVEVDRRAVRVLLKPWERPFAGGRARLVLAREVITKVQRVNRPTRAAAAPGGRAGLLVTGVLKLGRWGIGTGTSRFVSVRRWMPAIRLVVDRETAGELGYDELLISTKDVDELIAALGSASVPESG